MPVSRRRLAALVAAGVLAVPASALGQSAGDEQYQDPFANEDQGQSQSGSDEPAAVPTPAPVAPGSTPPPAEQPVSPDGGPAAQPQLPYTGADAGGVLLAGSVLLAAGIVLRIRMRERS